MNASREKRTGRVMKGFCEENIFWIEDYALFLALKSRFGGKAWDEWPEEARDRHPAALENPKSWALRGNGKDEIPSVFVWQTVDQAQRALQLEGDFDFRGYPIYVVHDSADVWTHPELFKLDGNKRPLAVSGVPPDYFSHTGQLWGNPIYRWDILKETGYEWWVKRVEHNLKLFDLVRIDHFRGFVGYWEVPAGQKTAINGKWVKAPAKDFS